MYIVRDDIPFQLIQYFNVSLPISDYIAAILFCCCHVTFGSSLASSKKYGLLHTTAQRVICWGIPAASCITYTWLVCVVSIKYLQHFIISFNKRNLGSSFFPLHYINHSLCCYDKVLKKHNSSFSNVLLFDFFSLCNIGKLEVWRCIKLVTPGGKSDPV